MSRQFIYSPLILKTFHPAILLFCGYIISPNFAHNLCFYLEGEPSSLRECTKLSFMTPLHKVLCTRIPISPPYAEPATYDVWYTTSKPVYRGVRIVFLSFLLEFPKTYF